MATPGVDLDFLLVGSGKSGTTTIASLLSRHADVTVTEPKEPWFFDTRDYFKGMSWYWKQYLGHHTNQRCVGEASSQSLFVPFVPERLAATVPKAKFVAILRDPVDRAYSDWWMKYCTGLESRDFEAAIEQNLLQIERGLDFSEPEIWQDHIDAHARSLEYTTYLDYGNYATQVVRYLAIFPSEQLLFLLTDELRDKPDEVQRQLFDFLGIAQAEDAILRSLPIENASRSPLVGQLRRRLRRSTALSRSAEATRNLAKPLIGAKAGRSIRRTLRWFDRGEKPEMAATVRAFLADFYREEIDRLGPLIGKDLSIWRHDH